MEINLVFHSRTGLNPSGSTASSDGLIPKRAIPGLTISNRAAGKKSDLNVIIASTFTAEPVSEYINWWGTQLGYNWNVEFSGYNQVFQELLGNDSRFSGNTTGINVLLLRFEDYLRNSAASDLEKISMLEQICKDMMDAIQKASAKITMVISLFPASKASGAGPLIINKVDELNGSLRDSFAGNKNCIFMEVEHLHKDYLVKEVFDLVNDREGHMPFTEEYYAVLGTEIARRIASLNGHKYKAIVLDCDNTLWKGICGEAGYNGVEMTNGHLLLQKTLLQKLNEGFLLAICSKNNVEDVMEVFENNKDMILKKENIIISKISWNDKSISVREIAAELNIGLDSLIFIDDSPVECMNMLEKCPEVLTLRIPEEERLIPYFVKHIWPMDRTRVTIEDTLRMNMYLSEARRKESFSSNMEVSDYIKKLDMNVSMRLISESEIERAAQLTQRTNQFNFTTKRRSGSELSGLISDGSNICHVVEAKDKYGEYGIIGLVILKRSDESLVLDTFLLSCRVLNRNVDEAVLVGIRKCAEQLDIKVVDVNLLRNAKNKPAQDFIDGKGWIRDNGNTDCDLYRVRIEDLPEEIEGLTFYYNSRFVSAPDKADAGISEKFREEHVSSYALENEELEGYSLAGREMQDRNRNSAFIKPLVYWTGKQILAKVKELTELTDMANKSIEDKLKEIWGSLLKIDITDNNSDFFNIGGDSLSAVIMISRIKKTFNIELSLKDIFEYNSIKMLTDRISKAEISAFEKIAPVEPDEFYETSSAQKRMYVLNQISNGGTGYNETHTFKITGNLDRDKLEKAISGVIERHEALRTGFEAFEGIPCQKVYDAVDFELEYAECMENEPEDITRGFTREFDLSKPPLLRVKLLRTSDTNHILLLDIHHIIVDGLSFEIIAKDILSLYEGIRLEPLNIQYKDFAVWQNKFLSSTASKKMQEFWLDQLKGEIPSLNLPLDHVRPSIKSFNGRTKSFRLDALQTGKIKALCSKCDVTVFMTLFAAFGILLHNYSGQEDIIVGVPSSGRSHADLKNIVGMFTNTLPVRSFPRGNMRFAEYLEEIKDTVLETLSNQDFQYDSLLGKLDITRDLSRNPLFDVMFDMQNIRAEQFYSSDFKLETLDINEGKSKFDISMFSFLGEEDTEFKVEYNTDIFNDDTIDKMIVHYKNIIEAVLADSSLPIREIEMLSPEEKERIVNEFNATQTDYPSDKTINELFEAAAEQKKNDVAVVFNEQTITYDELNKKANKIARLLREKGVKNNTIVAILAERSIEMIIGILAVIKAGGAYLPVDPEYPEDRIEYMLGDSKAEFMLIHNVDSGKLSFAGEKILIADETSGYENESNLSNIARPDDAIYVIYTSGSTGKPKGVVLEHRNITNFITGVTDRINFVNGDAFLGITTISFDIFVLETWLPLIKGYKIVLADRNQQLDAVELKKLIVGSGLSIIQMTPSRMKLMIEDPRNYNTFNNVRLIMLGGEALEKDVLNQLKKLTDAQIFNMYGPTETAVWSSIKELTHEDEITIGDPIANTQFYILNKDLRVQPVNVPGELYIAGDGLARGYHNNLQLTKERFVDNPFRSGSKMYKTGDLVKMKPDYSIEFLARVDDQVKIRGFRIELAEINNCISSFEDIKRAVVLAEKDSNGNYALYAYFIAGSSIDINKLKGYLSSRLPNYMVPYYYHQVEKFPETANGKLDRKALFRDNHILHQNDQSDTDLSELEKVILQVWKRLVSNDIGVNDNFFTSGGDSLTIMRVIAELSLIEIELKPQDFFEKPTVRQLAQKISDAENDVERANRIYPVINNTFRQIDASKALKLDRVLLTGATGFLGIHILEELLKNPDSIVYCLIRGEQEIIRARFAGVLEYYFGDKYTKLIDKRIICLAGDVSLECFGLGADEYEELGRSLKLVIHSAGLVKHQGDYAEFERINVNGTANVLKFVNDFGIRLGHISTMSVSGDYVVKQKTPRPEFTENDFYIGQSYYDNVYVRSKFEAEEMVINAINNGLNAVVFRLGFITGRHSDGKFQINAGENKLYSLIKAIIGVGLIPGEILKDEIDFSPVDFCARGIAGLLSHEEAYGNVLNYFNSNRIKLGELHLIIQKIINRKIEIINEVKFFDFLRIINKSSRDSDAIGMISSSFNYEKILLNDRYRVSLNCDKTRDYLYQSGFEWCPVD
ncbi:MAG: amino acid adenylation domain-containing protein, partial [Clostridiales bacterium]|nr:amino acid adenylation domain-containing protein [Clostridiales bacterium]